MKIVNKKPNITFFQNLSCGEVFKDVHSNYCMKIELNGDVNMVYLSNGELGRADNHEMFERVTCELVVSD